MSDLVVLLFEILRDIKYHEEEYHSIFNQKQQIIYTIF